MANDVRHANCPLQDDLEFTLTPLNNVQKNTTPHSLIRGVLIQSCSAGAKNLSVICLFVLSTGRLSTVGECPNMDQ